MKARVLHATAVLPRRVPARGEGFRMIRAARVAISLCGGLLVLSGLVLIGWAEVRQ